MVRMLVFSALALVLACLPLRTDAQSPCPEDMHSIYLQDGTLVSCEEFVGVQEACPGDAVGGYLEDGTLAGCYSSSVSTEEVCFPTGEDADEDGLDDGCDPCLGNADCDSDGFTDGAEVWIGTDPLDACPDDRDDAAWPPDMDNNARITIGDVLYFRLELSRRPPDRRFDLNADTVVTIGDVLLYRWFIGMSCEATVQPLDGTSFPVIKSLSWGQDFPVSLQRIHGHAEFRWTIHFAWPIPDLVDVKYSMDFGVEMAWLDYFNISVPNSSYCFVNDEFPYRLEPPWVKYEPIYPGPAGWRLECKTRVWVFPDLVFMGYPARIWIDWQIPGYYDGDASGFHKYWMYEH